MNSEKQPDRDAHLRAVLREWKVDAPLPPRFQEQVWQRIAAAEAPSRSAFWPSVIGLLEGVLPRPKVAFSYVAALAVLGVAAGSVTAQLESAHLIANLSARYVQSVDPYHAEAALP